MYYAGDARKFKKIYKKVLERLDKEKQTESLNPGNSSNLLPTNDGGLVSYGTKELIQQVKKLNDDKIKKFTIKINDKSYSIDKDVFYMNYKHLEEKV
jgi:hypothetical protein